MMKVSEKEAEDLVLWYERNHRSLPWRDTGNPYHVWISEIMLQQTRIEAVKPKYEAFLKALPDIQALAECEDDRLMRLWEGLGYYSRARNLKKCASVLVRDYEGKLPVEAEVLKKLPGIGPYTAGAIASIAYGQPVPAVDGNVLRVLTRLFGIRDDIRDSDTRKKIEDTLSGVYSLKKKPAFYTSFNQGLMELGEVICVPNGIPHCTECPWKEACQAGNTKTWDVIPYRSPLKKRKILQRTLLIIRDGDSFLLHKRPETGLLAGLYEFPGEDGWLREEEALARVRKMGLEPLRLSHLPEAKHIFTHLEWHMHAYEIRVAEIHTEQKKDYVLLNKKELSEKAVPSAFKKYTDWYALRD
jgi:A/G-specific adenine glycosylase